MLQPETPNLPEPPRLAIQGGPAAMAGLQGTWPPADDEIRQALLTAWQRGDWGRYHGPHGQQLEQALAEYHQVEHVWLCSSGTIAVELALRGLQVGPGREVLLAGYDFPGNFRAVEAVGARPVLVDIDPLTWCIDAGQLEAAASADTAALIVSHLHGGLAPMRRIVDWAARRGIQVVEDACQAPGARVDGRPAGTWGDAGVLSFGGSKLLTAGRGGALLTPHAEVRQRVKTWTERGNNACPLSELQAAVLVPQLSRLDDRNRQRAASARQLIDRGSRWPALSPIRPWDGGHAPSFYKLAWRYDASRLAGCPIERCVAALQAEGVPVDRGFRGFAGRSERRCRRAGPLDESRRAAEQTVLLHHPILLEPREIIERLAAAIDKVLQGLGSDADRRPVATDY